MYTAFQFRNIPPKECAVTAIALHILVYHQFLKRLRQYYHISEQCETEKNTNITVASGN